MSIYLTPILSKTQSKAGLCSLCSSRTRTRENAVLKSLFFLTVQINESHYTYTVDGKEDIRGANFKGLIIDSRLLA